MLICARQRLWNSSVFAGRSTRRRRRMGISAEQTLRKKLEEIPLPSLRVFESEFLGSFGKTLDEMTEEEE